MDINNIEEIKNKFNGFENILKSGDINKAIDMLEELLEGLENDNKIRKAACIDREDNVKISEKIQDKNKIYISLNHVMEYYIYACYFEPDSEVLCTDIPFDEYYRTLGDLCLKAEKYHAAQKAYRHAIEWNPIDLDAYLGLAESYKFQNKLKRFEHITKLAYRFCCTRATMARYYRNMAFYYLSLYKPEIARDCYLYSNVYFHTENADSELKFIKEATKQETPETDIKKIQKVFDENGIEPGPDSKTIGIIYKTGEIMLKDKDYALARDCFSIVYDITQEDAVEKLLNEIEKMNGV